MAKTTRIKGEENKEKRTVFIVAQRSSILIAFVVEDNREITKERKREMKQEHSVFNLIDFALSPFRVFAILLRIPPIR